MPPRSPRRKPAVPVLFPEDHRTVEEVADAFRDAMKRGGHTTGYRLMKQVFTMQRIPLDFYTRTKRAAGQSLH